MNRNYKVIWNASLNCFMAVAEYAKSRGKSSGGAVSSSSSASAAVSTGARLLRVSAICAGLAASGLSMQATAANEYEGDIGGNVFTGLYGDLNVKGGESTLANLTNNNIGVVGTDTGFTNTLTIKLAKDLTGLTSANFGAAPPANGNAAISGVTISGAGINNDGKQITELASAGNVKLLTNAKNAVNVTDLNNAIDANKTHFYSVNSTDATAGNYNNDGATGVDAMAAGIGATATANRAVAMGTDASAIGPESTALGSAAQAFAGSATAVGFGARADQYGTTAMGVNSRAQGEYSTAVGQTAKATGANSVALGKGSEATDDSSTALGSAAQAFAGSATAVGFGARADQYGATAMGVNSRAQGEYSTAVGQTAKATGASSVAIGDGSEATKDSNIALGNRAQATGNQSIAQGSNAKALGSQSIAQGTYAKATGNFSSAQGYFSEATQSGSIAQGRSAKAFGVNSIAMGTGSKAFGTSSIAIGTGNVVSGDNSGAFGDPNSVSGTGSYAIGNNNTIDNDNTFVLGNDVVTSQDNSVVLGNGSSDRAFTIETGAGQAVGVVSVGSDGGERQVINVAAGALNAASTDAVNGSQLFTTNSNVTENRVISQGNMAALGGSYDSVNGSYTAPVYNVIVNTATGATSAVDTVAGAVNALNTAVQTPLTFAGDNGSPVTRKLGQTLKVKGGRTVASNSATTNISVTADGTDTLSVKLAEDIDLGTNGSVRMGRNGLLSVNTTVSDTGVSIVRQIGFTPLSRSSATLNSNSLTFASGPFGSLTGTGAATLNSDGLTILGGPQFTKNSINAGGNQIKDVTAGTLPTDAVNVSQLGTAAAASKTEVVKGTNVTVTNTPGTNGQNVYTVNADGTTVSSANANALTVTPGTKDTTTNLTDYSIGLGTDTVASLLKADNSVQYDNPAQTSVTLGGVGSVTPVALTNVASGGVRTVAANANNAANIGDLNTAVTDVTTAGFAIQAADGNTVQKNLGQAVEVVGSNSNITTKVAGGKIAIALNNDLDLGANGSVTMGSSFPIGLGPVTTVDRLGVRTGNALVNTIVSGVGVTVSTINPFNPLNPSSATLSSNGLNILNGPSVTKSGIDAGNRRITRVSNGVDPTDAVNLSQLTGSAAAARTEVVAGTNVADVEKSTGLNGQDIYTVNANGSKTSAGSLALEVTSTTDANNLTDYAVDLSQGTKDSLGKADSAMQNVITQIDGVTVKTLDKDDNTANFITGDNIALTADSSGIKVALKNQIDLSSAGSLKIGDASLTNSDGRGFSVNGSKIVDVADGNVGEFSKQAINGSQLFETNQVIDQGLKFRGDNGSTITRKLGQRLDITGGAIGNLTTGNIAVSNDGSNGLIVELAENVDLGATGSIETGATTVNNAGISVLGGTQGNGNPVRLTEDGLFNGGNTIKGVADGRVDETSQQAINGSQLNTTNDLIADLTNGVTGIVREDSGNGALSVGSTADATGDNSIAMGRNAIASGKSSISIGTGNEVSGNNSGAIGDPTVITGNNSYSLGNDNNIGGNRSFTIGNDNTISGNKSSTLGNDNIITGNRSFALGNNNTIAGNRSFALGNNITIGTGVNGAVGIGNNTSVNASTVASFDPTGPTGIVGTATGSNVVSIGRAGDERRLTNVAAGGADTDAVNVSQLKAVDGKVIQGFNISAQGGTADNVQLGETVDFTTNSNGNLLVTKTTDNTINYDLANDITVESVTIGNGTNDTKLTTDVRGLSVNQSKIVDILDGDVTSTSQQAINGRQLFNTIDGVTTLGLNFVGDSGGVVNRPLGQTLKLEGGSTATLTNNNIGVVKNGVDGLEIKLAEAVDLGANGSVKLGNVLLNTDARGLSVNQSKIVDILDGNVNAGSQQAINGRQLFNNAQSVANNFGGNSSVNADGTVSAPTYTVNGASKNNVGDAITALDQGFTLQSNGNGAAAVKAGDVVDIGIAAGENNLQVTKTGNNITYNLKKNLDLGATGSVKLGSVLLNTDVRGLSVNQSKIVDIADGDVTATSQQAVNGRQLFQTNQDVIAAQGTANKGFNIKGGSSTADNVQLGDTVNFTNTDGNLVATNSDNGINYDLADAITVNQVTIGDGTNDTVLTTDGRGLSVNQSKIVDILDGDITSTSQQAINGRQLNRTNTNVAGNMAALGGGATYNPITNAYTAPKYTLNNGNNNANTTDYNNVGDALGNLDGRMTNNTTAIDNLTNGTTGLVRQDSGTGNITVGGTTGGTNVNFSGTAGDRVLSGVAAGSVAAGSKDAINGGQLYAQGAGVAGIIGGTTVYNPSTGNFTNANIGDTGKSSIHEAIKSVNTAAAAKTTVTAGDNIVVDSVPNGDGSTNYRVSTSKNLNVDSVKADDGAGNITTVTAVGTSVTNGDYTTKYSATGSSQTDLTGNANNITALGQTIAKGANITTATSAGTDVTDGTNRSIHGANGFSATDAEGKNGTVVDQTGVSFRDSAGAAAGPNMTAAGIKGVVDGRELDDAVNFGQLSRMERRLGNSVNELGYRIGEVEDDANAGISAAMAMSSLPQSNIAGRSMVGGGIATYNGESAVAVGVSRVSDNGRWVMKVSGTADTQGNAGGSIGAGFHF
ncbi:autotransporter adhesin [Psychrobacter sp. PL15]|uniref:YadA-like family protein n=1 Tax=Psychrobacter sp. PL15 TaxID=3071719 RepID=UPI002E0678DE|nr:autotransporter adhesin [Psychrobacter sp. PL15]